jgi:hypothetical protein
LSSGFAGFQKYAELARHREYIASCDPGKPWCPPINSSKRLISQHIPETLDRCRNECAIVAATNQKGSQSSGSRDTEIGPRISRTWQAGRRTVVMPAISL